MIKSSSTHKHTTLLIIKDQTLWNSATWGLHLVCWRHLHWQCLKGGRTITHTRARTHTRAPGRQMTDDVKVLLGRKSIWLNCIRTCAKGRHVRHLQTVAVTSSERRSPDWSHVVAQWFSVTVPCGSDWMQLLKWGNVSSGRHDVCLLPTVMRHFSCEQCHCNCRGK